MSRRFMQEVARVGRGTPGHRSSAKFWCKFNGTDVGPITPDASYNVVDVTDNGTGDYTVNIDTDFPSGNWSPYLAIRQFDARVISIGGGTINVTARGSGGAAADPVIVSVGGFGDQ